MTNLNIQSVDPMSTLAAQFNLQPEQLMQLMALVQTMQSQATPAQPVEQPARTVPVLTPKAANAMAADADNWTSMDLLKKFEPITHGDVSCVTAEADFKSSELYDALYGSVHYTEELSEDMRENCLYELKKTAQRLGGRALASLFKTKCEQARAKREEEKRKIEADKKAAAEQAAVVHGKLTQFTGLPENCTGNKYISPEWSTSATAAWTTESRGSETRAVTACTQPVLINRQLEPIDGIEDVRRVELMYEDGKKWRTSFEELETLFNANKVLALANKGIAITKKNAPEFCEFMASMYQESVARDALPMLGTMTKLGWSKDKKIFMPYVTGETDVLFDQKEKFSNLLETLKPTGESEVWYEEFKKLRATKYQPLLLLTAAALAAPIVGMTNLDGFAFNIHSSTTTGKSYTTAMVMTLWGFAGLGSELFMAAKATRNGFEIKLDTLNNIPLVIEDTASLGPKAKAEFQEFVMDAANGRGKTRATKTLGLQRQRTWRTVTIITSEGAVDSGYTTGGSRARVIKFLSTEKFPLWDEMAQIAEVMEHNYGFGGRDMILALQELGEPEVKRLIDEFNKKLKKKIKESGKNKQDRQIISAALMMTADYIAEKYLFKDGILLDIDDVIDMLDDATKINQAARVYESMVEKIFVNSSHVEGLAKEISDIRDPFWGVYDREEHTMSFLPAIWHQLLQEADMDETQFTLYLRQKNLLIADAGAQSKKKSERLGSRIRVYKIVVPDSDEDFAKTTLDRIAACPEATLDDESVTIPADVLRNTKRTSEFGFSDDFTMLDFIGYTRQRGVLITNDPASADEWMFHYSRTRKMTEEEIQEVFGDKNGPAVQDAKPEAEPQPQTEQLVLDV